MTALSILSCGNCLRRQATRECGTYDEYRSTATDSVETKNTGCSVSMGALVRQLTEEGLGSLNKGLCNAEKGMILSNLVYEFHLRSQSEQATIRDSLKGVALTRYNAERKAFIAWDSYQRKVANEAIDAIWRLFVGGSAGASVGTGHLYDVACVNLADQQLMAGALTDGQKVDSCVLSATFRQIEDARMKLYEEIQFCIDTPGIAEGREVTVEEMKRAISILYTDYRLFKDWMAKRKSLASALREPARSALCSNTDYWMHFYCKNYQERFN